MKLLIAALAFAFFIVCPRMAGMTSVIANATDVDLVKLAVVGTIIAIPFVVGMVLIYTRYGLLAALGFAVLTDLLSALVIKEISLKAGIETLIVALFVIIGVRVATYVSKYVNF
ncbi:hypothetical protein DRP05_02310 [Archaeoglobales archaeon]|nr:MAG: hypothetical protein DRP05_02310 [Archaeoglobales archaeon]